MTLFRSASAAAAALLFLILLSVLRVADLSQMATFGLLGLVALSVWRPDVGLVIVAAALPVASWFGRSWTTSGLIWANVLMVAFGCGFFVSRTLWRAEAPADRPLGASTFVMAAIVGASLTVQLAVFLERLGGPAFRLEMWYLATRDFFIANRGLPVVVAAALLLQGLIVFHAAARLTATSDFFRRAAPRAMVAGAAVAAWINVWRILEAAWRSGHPVDALWGYLQTERINEHYPDMNAAGSYFVLALWVAIGLALDRRGRGWWLAAAIIAAGLWMTGSRTAVLAGLVAGALPLLFSIRPRGSRSKAIAAAGVTVLAIAGTTVAAVMPERGTQQSPSTALQVRAELTRTALRMAAARPVFGVGAGEFYHRSGEFSSPALLTLFPPARNENAHNNFLQILAELGVAGFGAFLWILALTARRAASALRASVSRHDGAYITGLPAGILAFLLTCLAGHPLLIPEAAGSFWLALGLTAGWSRADLHAQLSRGLDSHRAGASASAVTARPERLQRLVAAVVLMLVVSLPFRVRQQIADSNLEHVGIGLSAWQRTDDNLQYRVMAGVESTVFVPADAGSVTLPLRAAVDGVSENVEMRLDGRLANVVQASSDRWTNVLIVLPPRAGGPRFRRLDLAVPGEMPHESGVLLVGKVVPH